MSDEVVTLFATFAMWWAVIFIGYVLLLAAADLCLAAWKSHQRDLQRRRDALQHVADEQAAAVQRIGSAFLVAQQLIRREADAGRGDRP